MLIKNAKIFVDGAFTDASIRFQDRIEEIGPDLSEKDDFDAEGAYVIPGLIDIHTHGAVGEDASDGSAAGLEKMSLYYAAGGVTSWCPTTMTVSEEDILRAVGTIRRFRRPEGGAKAAAINMEGPFVSPFRLGAQNPNAARLPSLQLLEKAQEESDNMVRLITVAPELVGSEEFIRQASESVTVSVGHTACDYEDGKKAFEAGASHVTHLFNCIPDMAHRKPGPIPAAMEAKATAELITDGMHVHPAMIRTAFELFEDRIVLVSDSLRCAGMPDGAYTVGGLDVTMQGGRAMLTGTDTLAGSSIHLMEGLRRCVGYGIPLERAVTAATTAPARVIGMDGNIGTLKPGKLADLVVLNADLSLKRVYIEGSRVV